MHWHTQCRERRRRFSRLEHHFHVLPSLFHPSSPHFRPQSCRPSSPASFHHFSLYQFYLLLHFLHVGLILSLDLILYIHQILIFAYGTEGNKKKRVDKGRTTPTEMFHSFRLTNWASKRKGTPPPFPIKPLPSPLSSVIFARLQTKPCQMSI